MEIWLLLHNTTSKNQGWLFHSLPNLKDQRRRVIHHHSRWTFIFQTCPISSAPGPLPAPHFPTLSPFSWPPGLSFLATIAVVSHAYLCLETPRGWVTLERPRGTAERLPPRPKGFTSILLQPHRSPTTPWALSLLRNTPPFRPRLPNLWLAFYLPTSLLPYSYKSCCSSPTGGSLTLPRAHSTLPSLASQASLLRWDHEATQHQWCSHEYPGIPASKTFSEPTC